MLHLDTIRIICKFLSDTDVNNLLSVNRHLYTYKKDIQFRQKHTLTSKIYILPYYDSFINLRIEPDIFDVSTNTNIDNNYYQFEPELSTNKIDHLPKHISKISLVDPREEIISLILSSIKSITVEIFEDDIFELIQNLPVTKLIIYSTYIDRKILISSTVKHLKFIGTMYEDVKNIIYKCSNPTHIIFTDVPFNNYKIRQGDIPESVTHLNLGDKYDQELGPKLIPKNIQRLDAPNKNGHMYFPDHLFPSLRYIKVKHFYPGEDVIPSSVTCLEIEILESFYHAPADNYHTNIKSLIILNKKTFFNNEFLYELMNPMLKMSPILTTVTFKCNYHWSLLNSIPLTVTHLIFDCEYISSLVNCVPLSVTHLVLPSKYNKNLSQVIPKSVKYLTLSKYYCGKLDKNFLDNISVTFY